MSALRIASNNCFWFQGRPFAPDRPGEPVPGILGPLAGVYRRLEPGLLCIQEVQSAAAAVDAPAREGHNRLTGDGVRVAASLPPGPGRRET